MYNSYLEKRLRQKIPQYGESDTKKKAKENVVSRDKAIAGNLVNEIRQKCFCWTSFVPLNPTMVPYFTESLQVSNFHCGTFMHNTVEYVRGGVEEECCKSDLRNYTQGGGVDGDRVTSEIMPPFEAPGLGNYFLRKLFSDYSYFWLCKIFLLVPYISFLWLALHDIVSSVFLLQDCIFFWPSPGP